MSERETRLAEICIDCGRRADDPGAHFDENDVGDHPFHPATPGNLADALRWRADAMDEPAERETDPTVLTDVVMSTSLYRLAADALSLLADQEERIKELEATKDVLLKASALRQRDQNDHDRVVVDGAAEQRAGQEAGG